MAERRGAVAVAANAVAARRPHTPVTRTSTLAIFAVARGEQRYIQEWVLYHLHVGVDFIYVYDNEDEPTYHEFFDGEPRVVVVHIRVSPVQPAVFRHFFRTYAPLHAWACHIDVDEYINLRRHGRWTSVKHMVQHFLPNYLCE